MIPQDALRVGEALVQTLWVGALWVVGYLVAPALFAYLDSNAAAGRVAGELFRAVSLLSMACGVILLLASLGRRAPPGVAGRLRSAVILVMMGLIAASEWLVRPMMEAARLPDGSPGEGFGLLHGVSASLYLLASIGGILLVATGCRRISVAG